MNINEPMFPINENLNNVNDKTLFKLYVDNIIDMESLSKKDKNYTINKIILSKNINDLKKELIKRKNKYICMK